MSNRKECMKEYHKTYYEENKQKLNEYRKTYYKEYKDERDEYTKQYRLNNPDKVKQYEETRNAKIICNVCGSTTSKHHIAKHQQTNKCKNHIQC